MHAAITGLMVLLVGAGATAMASGSESEATPRSPDDREFLSNLVAAGFTVGTGSIDGLLEGKTGLQLLYVVPEKFRITIYLSAVATMPDFTSSCYLEDTNAIVAGHCFPDEKQPSCEEAVIKAVENVLALFEKVGDSGNQTVLALTKI